MGEQLKFSAWRVQPRIDAGVAVWVCEKGHVDDHHFELAKDVEEVAALCSRCGGSTKLYCLDQLAYELRHRRQQVEGLLSAVENHRLFHVGGGLGAFHAAKRRTDKESRAIEAEQDRNLWSAADQVRKELEDA